MTTPRRPAARDTCRVALCRGCCCGTASKHPDSDHPAQAETLAAAHGAVLTVTGCLGNCERSNTVVVVPSAAGRAAGGAVTWLGRVLDTAATRAVADWVDAGGPGIADLPALLAAHVQAPPQRPAHAPAAVAATDAR